MTSEIKLALLDFAFVIIGGLLVMTGAHAVMTVGGFGFALLGLLMVVFAIAIHRTPMSRE